MQNQSVIVIIMMKFNLRHDPQSIINQYKKEYKMSNIHKDLSLFNELVDTLISEEEKNPVAERIDSDKLYETIDLSLNQSAMIDDEFKSVLKNVLVSTPKTATNLFFNQLFGGRS